MSEERKKHHDGEPRWRWYVIMVILVPLLIPTIGLYLRRNGWAEVNLQTIAGAFMLYWIVALVVAGLIVRAKFRARMAKLGSPLVDLQLTGELHEKLAAFAAARKLSVTEAAFDLLDRELPRPAQDKDEEELARVRNENVQLGELHKQTDSQPSALSIAVTIGILRRLLLLNGADEENRHLWRTFASETAARIIGDALEQSDPRELRHRDVTG